MVDFSFARYNSTMRRVGLAREIEAHSRRLNSLSADHRRVLGDDHGLSSREDRSDPRSTLIVANAPLSMTLLGS
jgi:hypothetical protein